jgi:sucrose phosphorylase
LVYQFSLAPLILHSFHSGDIKKLSDWVATLTVPYQNTSFFNFIASHDGIGIMPAKGILTEEEMEALVEKTMLHGGEVSYKTNSDGSESVYELNITLYDALNNPSDPDQDLDVKRFLASQAIMLSLAGVPGIYVHSLFGSRNCLSCVEESGRARSINRKKFSLDELRNQLDDPENIHTRVLNGYKKLLNIRQNHPAFHPGCLQRVLQTNNQVFSLVRSDPIQEELIMCLINASSENQRIEIDLRSLEISLPGSFKDLIGDKEYYPTKEYYSLNLESYQVMWLLAGDYPPHI